MGITSCETPDQIMCKTDSEQNDDDNNVPLPPKIEQIHKLIENFNTNQISAVDLSKSNLTYIPNCIDKFPNLTTLNLSENEIKIVPSMFYAGLQQLENLDLSRNLLSDFDIQPNCVHNLKYLNLSNNCFTNIPKWVIQLRCENLLELNYSDNFAQSYQCKKSSYYLNTTKLKKLHLKSSCLLNEDFDFLKSIKSLEYLDLSNGNNKRTINWFLDLDKLFIKPQWKNMEILKLNNLAISLFPEGIMWLETLKELYLTGNFLSFFANGIEFLVNLEVLDVSMNEIAAIPANITKLIYLRVLRLSTNKLEALPNLSLLPNLQELDLYDNSLQEFQYTSNTIQKLDLENNFMETKHLLVKDYLEKKMRLRQEDGISRKELRIDGPKINKQIYEYDDRNDDDDDDSFSNSNIEYVSNNGIVEENWDEPTSLNWMKNPDVTASDDEWQGEDGYVFNSNVSFPKQYVSEEDWIFIDVDEF